MREILFRGKRIDGGEWVEGKNIFWDTENRVNIVPTGELCFLATRHETLQNVLILPRIEVIPETVGQYTGLTDKNGKKIFEGDIVLFSWGDEKNRQPFCIEFVDGEFRATPKEITRDVWSIRIAGYAPDFEVIGNIHDNPELLKGETDA